MIGLLGGDDWGIGGQRKVDTWVGHQVGLELSQVDVEGTVESQRSSDGADNLTDQPVQVGVGWSLNVQVSSADIVDGFVVYHESAVRVLQGGMGGQNGVVWLDDSGRHLWCGIHGEFQFRFLAVVDAETFHEEGCEPRAGTTTKAVEDQESLETSALVGEFPDPVEDKVDNFLADGVVTSCVVVGSILFAGKQLFRME